MIFGLLLRRRWAACAAGALLAACVAATPNATDHGAAAATVILEANSFDPYEVQVDPGGTVTWDVRQGGHTIVADDGRFRFFGPDDGTIPAGETRSFTVGRTEEVIRYHCTIHGAGMAGAIVVGHPRPLVDDPTVIAVPGHDPENPMTVEGAVAAAEPGTRIEIAPGRYTVPTQVEIDLHDDELPHGLTIVGMGHDRSEVVIDVAPHAQRGAAEAVFHVTGGFVTLRNLTVATTAVATTGAGIHLDGANQAGLHDVHIEVAGLAQDGVRITDASGAGVHGVTVRGAGRAGIRIDPCAACGVRIADADLAGGLVGVLAIGARGVLLSSSRITGNAAGVVARRHDTRLSVIEVYDNEIADNDRRSGLPAVTSSDRRLAVGAGVWLDGATDSVVAGNLVAGNRFGVAVSGGAHGVTVSANRLGDNAIDLAWDGLGAGVCFAGHGGGTDTEPPAIQELYPCDRVTAGVPWPVVTAALVREAYR